MLFTICLLLLSWLLEWMHYHKARFQRLLWKRRKGVGKAHQWHIEKGSDTQEFFTHGMGYPGSTIPGIRENWFETHTYQKNWSSERVGFGPPLESENPMEGGAWWAAVHGVARSWTRRSNFTFTFHFHALEKEMATHSSVLAWRIPGTVEPGRLPSLGSHSVGHNWSDLAAAAAVIASSVNYIWYDFIS